MSSSTLDQVVRTLAPRAKHRVWVVSDLQQARPEKARRCLSIALDDFRALDLPPEQVWYLGDAVEGTSLPQLEEMGRMQVQLLGALNVPLKYVTGNHDFDYARFSPERRMIVPFQETVRRTPGWRTTDRLEDFYFIDSIGDHQVVFLSDHASDSPRWVTTHGMVQEGSEYYPYSKRHYEELRDRIAQSNKPTILCSHYAFPGGNRPSELMAWMMPLPDNVRLHLYGHSHIGDKVWGKENAFRKISGIDDHKAPQADIASLEDDRGSEIRSAILEIHPDNALALYFRDHRRRAWADAYIIDPGR